MISSQRLIIMLFIMNIMIGVIGHVYTSPTLTTNGVAVITQEQTNSIQYAQDYTKDETLYSGITNKQYITETTVGNPITSSKIILDVLYKGFIPVAISIADYETQIELIVMLIISLIQSAIYIIGILELWFLFKNKKNS